NLGQPAVSGSLSFENGAYKITAGGTDIGDSADEGFFAYQTVTGNFDFALRLAGVSPSDPWAKAGLMARETLDAGSRHASVLATPGLAGSFFESRASTDSGATLSGSALANYPNTWLRLRRAGTTFSGYSSFDGQTWSPLGSVTLSMGTTMYLGIV